jgi:hypothetical protein
VDQPGAAAEAAFAITHQPARRVEISDAAKGSSAGQRELHSEVSGILGAIHAQHRRDLMRCSHK